MLRLLLLFVVVVAGCAWYGYRDYQTFLQTPFQLSEAGRTFVVEKGWNYPRK